MKKLILLLALIVLQGCDPSSYIAPTSSTTPSKGVIGIGKAAPYAEFFGGVIFKNQALQGQFSTNLRKTTEVGQGCLYSVMGIAAWGNSGIDSIKKEAKITKISLVEFEEQTIFAYFYRRHCTNVYGSKDSIGGSNVAPIEEKPATKPKKK